MMFQLAFKNSSKGVHIHYQTTSKIYNIKRFTASTKTMISVKRKLFYADYCALLIHTEMEMQHLMDSFEAACTDYQFAKNCFAVLTNLWKNICRASNLCLRTKADSRSKVKVYNACVLTVLLYASETWTTYSRHLKQFKRFHQQCLRMILGIKWQMHISDTEILEMTKTGSIEVLISKQQLRWSRNLVGLPNERIPKQIFYGQLTDGKRLTHKPKKRFKDYLKQTFNKCGVNSESWKMQAQQVNLENKRSF